MNNKNIGANPKKHSWKKWTNITLSILLILGILTSGFGGYTFAQNLNEKPSEINIPKEENQPNSNNNEETPTVEIYDDSAFNPEILRESKNEIVLNDDVKNINVTWYSNVIKSTNTANQYTFDYIDENIRGLQVNDKFAVQPSDAIPSGLAGKVSSIEIVENQATITVAPVGFEEIVKEMDVAQIVPITKDMIIEYGPGVKSISANEIDFLGLSNNYSETSDLKITNLSMSNSFSNLDNVDSSKVIMPLANGRLTLDPIILDVGEIKLSDNVKVTGAVKLVPTLKADIDLREGWFNLPTGVDYFEVSLDNKMVSTLKLEVTYDNDILDMASVYRVQDGQLKQKYANYKNMTKKKCDEYREKLFTSKFPIPTAPGLHATVTWYLKITAEGKISIEAVYTQNNVFGIKYENKQFSPINLNASDVTVKGAADATIYGGAGIGIGLSYLGLMAASIEPEVGIEITAATSFEAELLETEKNKSHSGTFHDCYLCVDGDINLKIGVNAAVDAIGFGRVLEEEIYSHRWRLFDFYLTFGGTTHNPEFGFSECPYLNYDSNAPKSAKDNSGSIITLVCDVSGSMNDRTETGETKLEASKQAGSVVTGMVRDWSKQYPGSYGIGVVQFASGATALTTPSNNYSFVDDCIQMMNEGGGTNIASGLELGIEQLDNVTAKNKVIILMTDGIDSNHAEILRQAEDAKAKNIRVFTIGFGKNRSEIEEDILMQVATETNGEYQYADTTNIVGIIGSFMYAQQASEAKVLTDEQGLIAEGETTNAKSFTVPDDIGDLNCILYWPGSILDLIITDPTGRTIDENYPGAVINNTTIPATVTVSDPLPGSWKMKIKGIETSPEYENGEPYYAITSFKKIDLIDLNATPELETITLIGAYCLPIGLFILLMCSMLLVFVNSKKTNISKEQSIN